MAADISTTTADWARRLEELRARAPQLVDPSNEEAILLGEVLDEALGLAGDLARELAAEQARSGELQARVVELERLAGEG